MVYWLVLGVFLLVCLILGAGKIKIGLTWENLEGYLSLRYLFFGKTFSLAKSNDQKMTEKQSGKLSKKGGGLSTNIQTMRDFFPAGRKFLQLFARYGKITKLRITGKFGARDPYITGLSYGLMQSFAQMVKSFLPTLRFALIPNFEEESCELNAEGNGEIRLGSLLWIVFITLLHSPKRQIWRLVKNN